MSEEKLGTLSLLKHVNEILSGVIERLESRDSRRQAESKQASNVVKFPEKESPTLTKQHERLRDARITAGFRSARQAAIKFGWIGSTYGSHENGQSGLKIEQAIIYGEAFGVNPQWLVFGDYSNFAGHPKESKYTPH